MRTTAGRITVNPVGFARLQQIISIAVSILLRVACAAGVQRLTQDLDLQSAGGRRTIAPPKAGQLAGDA